jgi:hypothetical protein
MMLVTSLMFPVVVLVFCYCCVLDVGAYPVVTGVPSLMLLALCLFLLLLASLLLLCHCCCCFSAVVGISAAAGITDFVGVPAVV